MFVYAYQQARLLGMRMIMGERLALKVGGHAVSSCRRIDGFKAFGERQRSGIAAQLQYLLPIQQQFDRPSKPRPEFHLSGNGTFHRFTCKTSIQYESVGQLYRLTHREMVA